MGSSFDGLTRQQLKAGIEGMRLELFDQTVNDFDEAFRRLGEFQDRLDALGGQLGAAWSGDAALQAQEKMAATAADQDGPRNSARAAADDVAGRAERMREIQAQVRDMDLTDTSMSGLLWGSAKGAAIGGAIAGPIGSLTGGGFAYQQAQQQAHHEKRVLVEHMEALDREGQGMVGDLEGRRFTSTLRHDVAPPQVPNQLPEPSSGAGPSSAGRTSVAFEFKGGSAAPSFEVDLPSHHGITSEPGVSAGTSPSASTSVHPGGVSGSGAGHAPGALPSAGVGHGPASGMGVGGSGHGQAAQHSGFGLISNFLAGVGAVAGGTVVGGGASRLGAEGMTAGSDTRRGLGGNNATAGGGALDDGHHGANKPPVKVVDGPEAGLRAGQNKDAPHMPPSAGASGNGKDEDGDLKERPTWLVESEETWVKIEPVAPAVIG